MTLAQVSLVDLPVISELSNGVSIVQVAINSSPDSLFSLIIRVFWDITYNQFKLNEFSNADVKKCIFKLARILEFC